MAASLDVIALATLVNGLLRGAGAIQAGTGPAWMVAEHYAISEQPVRKWRSLHGIHDRRHATAV